MAGDGSHYSTADYHFDESKYKGFWKYYNSDTPRGRAGAAKINLSIVFGLGMFFYLKSKFSKK